MLADDVDDAGMRLLGVVQVGDRIAEPRPQMQQGRRRPPGHAPVAVRRARHHALEQAEHGAHAVHAVERRHEMHLGRAGIGEADIDPAAHQRRDKAFRAVHDRAVSNSVSAVSSEAAFQSPSLFSRNPRLICVAGCTGSRTSHKPQSFKQSGKPGGFLSHGRQARAQTAGHGKDQPRQDNADSDNGEDDRRRIAFHDGPFHAPARLRPP